MVHADASRFQEGVTKEEAYEQVLQQAEALFDGQRNWVCNLANTASLLWHAYQSLGEPSNKVNWAGFYTINPSQSNELILGPFHGKVACQTIKFGHGVCGTVAKELRTLRITDVDTFPGHIACDGDSRSEIVVPVVTKSSKSDDSNGVRLVAVIDIDCTVEGGFDEVDQTSLEKLAELLSQSCDWP